MPLSFKRSFLQQGIGLLLLAFLLLGTGFVAGYFWGKDQVICQVCQPQEVDFSLFWEAYYRLKEKFIDPSKIDDQEVLYGAIKGMVRSLDDPYTAFLDPEETQKFNDSLLGRFEGVGMEVGVRNKQLQVIAPLEGTPAQRAGLRPGDKIMKIDDRLTLELSLEEAVSLIRGPKGTKVSLTITREGWEEFKEFEIERALIEVPSLKWETKDGQIAYIKLYHFPQKASFDFSRLTREVVRSGSEKIVLDLRNNPGGYLEVATEIAGFFLKKGEVVVIEDLGQEKKEHRSQGSAVFADYPMVVLINQGSASASEILAGALSDNRGILLIGERSFGKGSVQQPENLRGGSFLKVTVARWLTPKGQNVDEMGLKPDIEIKMTDEDYDQDRDPQLDKALEILRGL